MWAHSRYTQESPGILLVDDKTDPLVAGQVGAPGPLLARCGSGPWGASNRQSEPIPATSACETRPHSYVPVVCFMCTSSCLCPMPCVSVSLWCACLSLCACSESPCVLVFVLLSTFLSASVSLGLCLSLALSFISKCVPWSLYLSHPVRSLVTPFLQPLLQPAQPRPLSGSLSRPLLRLWLLWRLLRRSRCLCCSPGQTPAAQAGAAAARRPGPGLRGPSSPGVPR